MLKNGSIGVLGCILEGIQTSTKQACIFPFEINQTSFNGCTTMFDPQNKTWCATKVDGKGLAVEGHRGHCHDTCPLDANGTSNSNIILLKMQLTILPGNKFAVVKLGRKNYFPEWCFNTKVSLTFVGIQQKAQHNF